MTLSCMGCSHCRRPDPARKLSSRHNNMASPSFSGWLGRIERTWSGSLGQSAAAGEKVMRKSSSKLRSQDGHAGSAVAVDCISAPRLVRCYRIKRDWSFQDPRKAVGIGGFQKFRIF